MLRAGSEVCIFNIIQPFLADNSKITEKDYLSIM